MSGAVSPVTAVVEEVSGAGWKGAAVGLKDGAAGLDGGLNDVAGLDDGTNDAAAPLRLCRFAPEDEAVELEVLFPSALLLSVSGSDGGVDGIDPGRRFFMILATWRPLFAMQSNGLGLGRSKVLRKRSDISRICGAEQRNGA